MKAKQLAELLEVIVRKVVREEMKPILKEIRSSSKPIIKEAKVRKVKDESYDPLDVSDILETKRTTKKTPTMEYTKNPLLNDMLNETAERGEWRTMDSQFGANQAQGFNRDTMASAIGYSNDSMIPDTDVDGKPVNVAAIQNSGVADALTRDYSQLMKTINAKKGK